ncbi:hypothetical protein BBD41_27005 [Paenibacillus ihbetae]|uniref:Uncharacterized protein n=1 Tax=Paenibacillus ihbetae TaxID=1870820 RepID=A0A1B2E7J7_9BACL|nr:hypothetical protein [Paenibacillus ihbetae]ANY75929.1 hypothetical protein BBD41_27005 [Paenibacillus ihbetae]
MRDSAIFILRSDRYNEVECRWLVGAWNPIRMIGESTVTIKRMDYARYTGANFDDLSFGMVMELKLCNL